MKDLRLSNFMEWHRPCKANSKICKIFSTPNTTQGKLNLNNNITFCLHVVRFSNIILAT
jgi:hypothetical protein